jgi:hypothetical protein
VAAGIELSINHKSMNMKGIFNLPWFKSGATGKRRHQPAHTGFPPPIGVIRSHQYLTSQPQGMAFDREERELIAMVLLSMASLDEQEDGLTQNECRVAGRIMSKMRFSMPVGAASQDREIAKALVKMGIR